VGRVFTAVCLFVFADDISKTDANLTGIQMFYEEFWERTYFGVKRSKVKVTTSKSVFRQNAVLPLLLRT